MVMVLGVDGCPLENTDHYGGGDRDGCDDGGNPLGDLVFSNDFLNDYFPCKINENDYNGLDVR